MRGPPPKAPDHQGQRQRAAREVALAAPPTPAPSGAVPVTPSDAAACWKAGRMTGPHRDRDTAGPRSARQARPRDASGRPLPYGAEGVQPVSEKLLPPQETLEAGVEMDADLEQARRHVGKL
ncbi:hypothetical protein GCM10009817_17080 [Terrabacter lapilli]|uniref:Uncharacterized protein n=1 Tax=Terrabacter lapilli TaxID=436231 RepID=A0ABN2RYM8_9MICO